MRFSKVFDKHIEAVARKPRVIAHKGGTRSGKTFSLMQWLLLIHCQGRVPRRVDVVSESFPHLKRGTINDAEDILSLQPNIAYEWNKSDQIITFSNGSKLRFFSADDWGKVKGSRRGTLYINEANRIPYETYRQLAVRTEDMIIFDWNPDSEFWFEKKGIEGREDTITVHSTYLDNPFLTAQQIADIESNKNDEEWWQVYGLGLIGKPQGLIFPKWEQVQDVPEGARLIGKGLDFGFTNDPTAIVAVYQANGKLYIDEECYEQNLTNDRIADRLRGANCIVVADSAEQKSIVEIRNLGCRYIQPCTKGKDSIVNGIDVMKRFPLCVTSRSLNLIYELRNYKWRVDKITGETFNIPVDKFNHAIDAARYCISNLLDVRPRPKGARARTKDI